MKNKRITNPHDKYFKESFSRKETVQSFIKEYLPEKLLEQIDLNKLEILKDTFIDKELSEHFSDILYKTSISGKHSYIYLLFEHKSYIDHFACFQILRNMIKIWEQCIKSKKNIQKLPVIIPLLIYHGENEWKFTGSITPLFEQIENTKEYIPDFKCEIYDISHIPDEQIRGNILLRVHFLILKYINSPQLFDKLHDIFNMIAILSEKKKKTEYLETFLRYLVSTVDKNKIEDIKTELKKSINKGDELMPTIAEMWIKEGMEKGLEKGMEKGMEKGIEKGIEKGKLDSARKMIKLNMSTDVIHEITGLSKKKIEELRNK